MTVPLIFTVPFPGWETKAGILAMGCGLILVNLLPLQLVGAVFGVLQLALGLQFIADARVMG